MYINRLTKLIAVPLLFGLSLVACTSGTADNSTTTTSTTILPGALALPYFEALAKGTRVGYETAAEMSAGAAREYALYLNEYLQAEAFWVSDGGTFKPGPLETARLDDSGRIQSETAERRTTYSDFVFVNNKLLDFKVEGRAISGNIRTVNFVTSCWTVRSSQCNSDGSVDLKILHSYISAAGNLIVVYSISVGSRHPSVREDRTSDGLPNHEVTDDSGRIIGTTYGIQTFARGESRINVVHFGPLNGGGEYSATFRFRSDGYLLDFKSVPLGDFAG